MCQGKRQGRMSILQLMILLTLKSPPQKVYFRNYLRIKKIMVKASYLSEQKYFLQNIIILDEYVRDISLT